MNESLQALRQREQGNRGKEKFDLTRVLDHQVHNTGETRQRAAFELLTLGDAYNPRGDSLLLNLDMETLARMGPEAFRTPAEQRAYDRFTVEISDIPGARGVQVVDAGLSFLHDRLPVMSYVTNVMAEPNGSVKIPIPATAPTVARSTQEGERQAESDATFDEKVFVLGAANEWQHNFSFSSIANEATGGYLGRVLMSEIAQGHAERIGIELLKTVGAINFNAARITTFATLGAASYAGIEAAVATHAKSKIPGAGMFIVGNDLFSQLVVTPKVAGTGNGLVLDPSPSMGDMPWRSGVIGERRVYSSNSMPAVNGNVDPDVLGFYASWTEMAFVSWKGLQVGIDNISNLSKLKVMSQMWHDNGILREAGFSVIKVTARA